jgi:pimeloyl-ACP methyl ester carboxylesterase
MKLLMAPMRFRGPRQAPFAFGWLVKKPIDRAAEDSYVFAPMTIPGVADDARKLLARLDKRDTNEAADKLGGFTKPALIAWSRDDRFFKLAHAEALAKDLPNSRLEWIEGARTFASEDQPERLADLIAAFVREPAPAAQR